MNNEIKSKIKIAFSVVGILLVFFIVCITLIQFDYGQICQTISQDDSYTIVTSKKTHRLIESKNIKKIKGEINDNSYYFYLYYQAKVEDNYVYWINPEQASFLLDEGSYTFLYSFCEINFISYIF